MSLHDLNQIVGRATKALYDNEKFPVGALAVRAEKAAQACPTDPTLVAMSNFLSKRASTQTFISRAELKDVYRRLYSQNNQFGLIFASELGAVEKSTVKVAHRDPNEGISLTEHLYENMGNPILAQALAAELKGGEASKPYTERTAKLASQACLHELSQYVLPRKVEVVAGKADVLICQATYETPKGQVAVLLPVEVKEGNPLLPTVLLSQHGFVDLTKEALEEHIVTTAGKSFKVDVNAMLQAVASVKSGGKKVLSEMELLIAKAAAKTAADKGMQVNGIINQIVDAAPVKEASDRLPEADTFAAKLASAKGGAEFVFGRDVVDGARSMLKQAMGNFGFAHANVAMASFNDSTMNFAVSLDNRTAFSVPVKVSNKLPQLPKIVVVAGSLYPFTKGGVSDALKDEAVDSRMMAAASPAYGLKSSELVGRVVSAMAQGNVTDAEDALAVLQESGDDAAFKEGFAAYMDGMSGKTALADCTTQCKSQRKVAHSKYIICGHTNLPVHKVYQDKHGDCQPLYRKHIAEATTGSFMTAKILGF